MSRVEVMQSLNIDSKLNLNIDSALAEVGQLGDWSSIIVEANEVGKTEVIESNGRYKQAVILGIQEPRSKELSEAKGRAVSDYQAYLEQEWLKDLKARYTVKVNQDVLNEVIEALD